jgi:predicted ATP-grasp superfamily ATP-dependent carboligase
LGENAGVDFTYMLFADQLGSSLPASSARPGVGWVRMTTDIPTAFLECWQGSLNLKAYYQSLKMCGSDAVFSLKDPVPGLVEMLLTPYLAVKRGF